MEDKTQHELDKLTKDVHALGISVIKMEERLAVMFEEDRHEHGNDVKLDRMEEKLQAVLDTLQERQATSGGGGGQQVVITRQPFGAGVQQSCGRHDCTLPTLHGKGSSSANRVSAAPPQVFSSLWHSSCCWSSWPASTRTLVYVQ